MAGKNILFILMDQFRADLLTGGLAEVAQLPHLRALMGDAVTFRNHRTVVTPCGPARASLLTGQYAMNHRSVRNGTPLDRTIPTLPGEFRKAGFDPLLFGYTDTSRDPRGLPPDDATLRSYEMPMEGFTEAVEMRQGLSLPWRRHLAARGYDLPPYERFYEPDGPDLDSPSFYSARDSDTAFLTDEFLRRMEARRDSPWFALLTYIRPHPPLVAPAPWNRLHKDIDIPAPAFADGDAIDHPLLAEVRARSPLRSFFDGMGAVDPSPENVRTARQVYLGLAAEVDHHIGRVVAWLKDSGQFDDTLLVVSSDHGEMLGEHGLWGKSAVFDAAFHVPLLIRDPGLNGAGRVIDAPTESIDLVPTLLDFAGIAHPTSLDGRSLYPLMRGESPPGWRDYSWAEIDYGRIPPRDDGMPSSALPLERCNLSVLREKDFTLAHFNGGLPALMFDHLADGEGRDVAGDPAYAADLLRLTRKMLDHRMTHANQTLSRWAVTEDGAIHV